MIKKVAERSSAFVVVSRKTLISGMACIAVLSFALGYFLGYGGPSSEKMVRHVQADNKAVPSEEKTVLDSSGKPTIVMPPSTPDAIPKEPLPRPAEPNKTAPKPEEPQRKPEAAAPSKVEIKEMKKDGTGIQNKGDAAPGQNLQKPQDKISDKPQGKTTERQMEPATRQGKQTPAAEKKKKIGAEQPRAKLQGKAKEKTKHNIREKKHAKKSYSLQAGSFHDAQKARRLKEQLDEKGYKSYIMTYSPAQGRTFSRVRLGSFESREEAEGIISELKDMGLEGIVVPGQR